MPDPITHVSPYLVTAFSAAAAFVVGPQFTALIWAAGGAYWAVYRNPSVGYGRTLLLILCSSLIGFAMVELAIWIFKHWFGMEDLPIRPIAFLLGFAVIDKPFREKVIEYIKSKADALPLNPGGKL